MNPSVLTPESAPRRSVPQPLQKAPTPDKTTRVWSNRVSTTGLIAAALLLATAVGVFVAASTPATQQLAVALAIVSFLLVLKTSTINTQPIHGESR